MQLRVLESECMSLVRRKMRALQSENLRAVMQQIRWEPHAVYGALKGRPKPLPLSMQTTDLWEPYVEKVTACDHEDDLQPLKPSSRRLPAIGCRRRRQYPACSRGRLAGRPVLSRQKCSTRCSRRRRCSRHCES